ncbi:MAG TPA: glycosyltransferase family 39 protein, partial [Thermoanaerobaculia bacterium]|nr:glycosyltransferase family 39 protein [Thermoanaerobaculia bacterium]
MTDPAAPGARLRFGMEGATRFLSSRAAPILFGCLTALEVAFLWGTISPVATIHDEAAYLFQAKVFATGRWTAPAPPLPEFFEQFHVLVTPVFAGKYPPGHSLLLVPGIWLGASGLMPCVLAGIAGGLLYLLARRFANPWAALLTWLIWTTSPGNLRYLPSYLSQSTTVALWLLGWWALAQWLQGKGTRWLMLLFSAAAWGALTRPFTFVGYAAASGFVVVREIAKRRAWGELARALVPAAAILGILPLWNARTTGDVRLTPYVLYLKTYFPAQGLGFGLPADRQPKRALPRDMILYDWEFLAVHEAYTLASVPKQLLLRVLGILGNSWDDWRWPLSFFFFLGLRERPREGL